MHFAGFTNYARMFQDKVFLRSVGNTFYLPGDPGTDYACACYFTCTAVK